MIDDYYVSIRALLDKVKAIADIWSIKDVQYVRPDLTDDQAWEVLVQVDGNQDCDYGITFQTLETTAVALFGEAPETDEAEQRP